MSLGLEIQPPYFPYFPTLGKRKLNPTLSKSSFSLLTASSRSSPVSNLNPLSLAGIRVGLQSIAQRLLMAFVGTNVVHTVLKEGLRIHFGVARAEGPVGRCNDQTAIVL